MPPTPNRHLWLMMPTKPQPGKVARMKNLSSSGSTSRSRSPGIFAALQPRSGIVALDRLIT